ncbi:MAG: OmpA family protein [Spirochaetota bacterium]
MKKKEKKQRAGSPAWMTTYGDMTTLLLTFFILMFNIADISGKDFYLVLSSFRGSLGMFEGGYSLSAGRLEELGQNMQNLPSSEQGRALARSLKRALEAFKPEIKAKKVRVQDDERGLVITLSGDAYFDPGSAKLKDEIIPVLDKVGAIIKSIDNYTRIEGHTDNRPVAPRGLEEGYDNNWELSAARSVNVVEYLSEEENVEPKQLSSVAFGEHRPIDDNNTPEGRAYNRRVDIVILRDRGMPEQTSSKISRPLPDEEWR